MFHCTVNYETMGSGMSWAYLDVEAADLTDATRVAARKIMRDKRRHVRRVFQTKASAHNGCDMRLVHYGPNEQQLRKI